MTSPIKDMLRKDPVARTLWFGTVARNATDLSDRLSVVVPDFDPQFIWEDCYWQSRDDHSLPLKGDRCLVALDHRNQAWVLAWWPFVT